MNCICRCGLVFINEGCLINHIDRKHPEVNMAEFLKECEVNQNVK